MFIGVVVGAGLGVGHAVLWGHCGVLLIVGVVLPELVPLMACNI